MICMIWLRSRRQPATMLAVMKLYDEGKINLTDKISAYVPQMKSTDKENITIQQLLYHESGLPGISSFLQESYGLEEL